MSETVGVSFRACGTDSWQPLRVEFERLVDEDVFFVESSCIGTERLPERDDWVRQGYCRTQPCLGGGVSLPGLPLLPGFLDCARLSASANERLRVLEASGA